MCYNYFKERKRSKSLQKAEVYLEPRQVSTIELFVNIVDDLIKAPSQMLLKFSKSS